MGLVLCFVYGWPRPCRAEVIYGYGVYTDWENWARVRVGLETDLASSYDRAGENDDYSQYESPPGLIKEEIVGTVKTIEGPGVVYRFWMPHLTANRNFPIRMYFDGESTPRIDTDSVAFLGGTYEYFADPLVTTCAGGQVCYEPIPFAQSLCIETVNKELPESEWSGNRNYYQYTYVTCPPGTAIDSYTGQLTPEDQQVRSAVISLFENVGDHPAGDSATAIELSIDACSIPADSFVTLADISGFGLVRRLNVRMDDANDVELDGLHLRVFYDGQETPSIDVSVAHFFGAGQDRAAYRSLPLGTDSGDPNDGFYCYWPMPFGESLLVQLFNTTGTAVAIDSAKLDYEEQAIDKEMCYLHAVENSSVKQPGQIYHTILSTTGRGHYVGELLYVEQASYNFYMLEGDDVITVDGVKTQYGTGLEDTYNGGYYYNWVGVQADEPEGAYPQSATRPLHGILYVHRESGVASARADQYRWRIADAVTFSRSMAVKVENRYAETGAQWISVVFWYQLPCPLEDLDDDCNVDLADLRILAGHWLETNCDQANWCAGVDLDRNGSINLADFAVFAGLWFWQQ